jgi:hypothetical protein
MERAQIEISTQFRGDIPAPQPTPVTTAPLTESRTPTVLLKRKAIYPDTQNTKDNAADRDSSSSNNSPCGAALPRNTIRGSRYNLISNMDSPSSSIKSVIPAIFLERRSARPKGTPSIYNKIEFADNIFGIPDTQITNTPP